MGVGLWIVLDYYVVLGGRTSPHMLLCHVHCLKSGQVYIELPVDGVKVHSYVGSGLIDIYPESKVYSVVFTA